MRMHCDARVDPGASSGFQVPDSEIDGVPLNNTHGRRSEFAPDNDNRLVVEVNLVSVYLGRDPGVRYIPGKSLILAYVAGVISPCRRYMQCEEPSERE